MVAGIDQVLQSIKWVDIETVIPYEGNPKVHTPDQIEKLAYTFEKYGFDVPIVVDQDSLIIKGHARLLAAKKLKWKQVPIIVREDLQPNEVKAARIADNKVAESYWDMPLLIAELEALYNLDDPLVPVTDTGFADFEIRSLLPGMLETEDVDYHIPDGTEGWYASFIGRLRQDGKIGAALPDKEKQSDAEILAGFSTIVVPTIGGKNSMAALLKAKEAPSARIVMLYAHPGTVQFPWTKPYLEHVAKKLDVDLIDVSPRSDENFIGRITAQGYPTPDNLWCESKVVLPAIEKYMKDHGFFDESVLMLLGAERSENNIYRRIGRFEDSYHYFCPFLSFADDDMFNYLEENMPEGIGLHPMYKHLTMIACPGCPLYKPPDFAFIKEDPETFSLWLKWLEYFGYSKRNKAFRYGGKFDAQLRAIICESIDVRAHTPFAELAMDRNSLEITNWQCQSYEDMLTELGKRVDSGKDVVYTEKDDMLEECKSD